MMLRKLYDWCIDLAEKPYALWALFIYAFTEASFFPLPVELMMIPLIIATPKRAWLIALIAIAGSVLGAIFGYYIGASMFELLAKPILDFYGYMDKFDSASTLYNEWGIWAVLVGGLTPIPFKVITILSGATGFNFVAFVLSSLAARAVRFGIIAILLYYFGAPIRNFIEKRLGLVFAAGLVLLIGGFLFLKVLH
jgi:membrane protein YqaA with SNARE-associated domain